MIEEPPEGAPAGGEPAIIEPIVVPR